MAMAMAGSRARRGGISKFLSATRAAIRAFDPFDGDDWQRFAWLAFQSGNTDVLDFILEESPTPIAIIDYIQTQCADTETEKANVEALRDATIDTLRKQIRALAIDVAYDARTSQKVRDLLWINPSLTSFSAIKAIELGNARMLQEIMSIILHQHWDASAITSLRNKLLITLRSMQRMGSGIPHALYTELHTILQSPL
jgi:hypothetical protein